MKLQLFRTLSPSAVDNNHTTLHLRCAHNSQHLKKCCNPVDTDFECFQCSVYSLFIKDSFCLVLFFSKPKALFDHCGFTGFAVIGMGTFLVKNTRVLFRLGVQNCKN